MLHVKKPGCPARKIGHEWPKWLFLWKKPYAGARGFFTLLSGLTAFARGNPDFGKFDSVFCGFFVEEAGFLDR